MADNGAYLDYWLLQRFPGRTLEELDAIDWPRLQRAVELERIVTVEQRRKQWVDGHLKEDSITPDEWRQIRQHDDLLEDMDDA